jgi:hypothetical protein
LSMIFISLIFSQNSTGIGEHALLKRSFYFVKTLIETSATRKRLR